MLSARNMCTLIGFLSTPSARRATKWNITKDVVVPISIHALREEGDSGFSQSTIRRRVFLSTPSARRATNSSLVTQPDTAISIHALREEGDRRVIVGADEHIDFYPRPPRGGRRSIVSLACAVSLFLSTPSARRATTAQKSLYCRGGISIHALREEGDSKNRDKISIFKQIIQHSARI